MLENVLLASICHVGTTVTCGFGDCSFGLRSGWTQCFSVAMWIFLHCLILNQCWIHLFELGVFVEGRIVNSQKCSPREPLFPTHFNQNPPILFSLFFHFFHIVLLVNCFVQLHSCKNTLSEDENKLSCNQVWMLESL